MTTTMTMMTTKALTTTMTTTMTDVDGNDDGGCGGRDGHHQMRKGRQHNIKTIQNNKIENNSLSSKIG